jgi:signal transduction histidine kinase
MARQPRVVRMSVEQPLWRAVTAYRLVTLLYAIGQYAVAYNKFKHPLGAAAYLAFLALWTLLTLGNVSSAERCTKRFLAADLTVALAGILLTPVVDTHQRIIEGATTLPSIWTAGSVLAFAVKGGWRPAAVASTLVGIADLIERGAFSRETIHNVVLVWIASIAIGYVVEVARASERVLARALQIEAATRERERLARDIHDSVLQVLAMVQRRGAEIGGEAEALGRMAGEQEVALRTLVSDSPVPDPRRPDEAAAVRRGRLLAGLRSGAGTSALSSAEDSASGPADLRPLLTAYGSAQVTVSAPATPVLVGPHAAGEIAAAVGAALDNVTRHVGGAAHAWVLLEDDPDAILVSVRDDGPGIPDGRLADAEREGRLGVAQSIRGRLQDLGGTAELISVSGQGAEVELRIPRDGGAAR